MNIYEDLPDDELDAKIVELRGKIEEVMMGGVAIVVAGNGRRIEYARANQSGIEGLLKAAIREKQARAGVQVSGAIQTIFPYGGDFGC